MVDSSGGRALMIVRDDGYRCGDVLNAVRIRIGEGSSEGEASDDVSHSPEYGQSQGSSSYG